MYAFSVTSGGKTISSFGGTAAVSGDNGALLPESTTTRAQMAQVLYNLLKGE